jgi:peptidoglycan/xylan/chitin deacetylase (PgdA/CDA1 family)
MQKFRVATRMIRAAACGGALAAASALAAAAPAQAQAQECPGNPNAIGTSRVLALEPGEFARVGFMQYRQSLPLAEKEVVLTFDDGPLPRYSNQVLDILAAQCVKATYFLVGSMARAYPAVVRRIYEEGHTIGTHSEDHPPRFQKLPVEKMRQEIDDGIADVGAALGDPKELAPFFRIPGLARSDVVEEELAARALVVFSSDTVADDWHHRIKPDEIVSRAISRLQARGKGILLLHDIHAATVAALPDLLARLKEAGFHIVHVVPAIADRIETAGTPALRMGERSRPRWAPVAAAAPDDRVVLPAPDTMSFATDYRPRRRIVLADRSANAAYLALAAATEWTEPLVLASSPDDAEFPAPDLRDIGLSLLERSAGEKLLGLGPPLFTAADKAESAVSPLPPNSPLE